MTIALEKVVLWHSFKSGGEFCPITDAVAVASLLGSVDSINHVMDYDMVRLV